MHLYKIHFFFFYFSLLSLFPPQKLWYKTVQKVFPGRGQPVPGLKAPQRRFPRTPALPRPEPAVPEGLRPSPRLLRAAPGPHARARTPRSQLLLRVLRPCRAPGAGEIPRREKAGKVPTRVQQSGKSPGPGGGWRRCPGSLHVVVGDAGVDLWDGDGHSSVLPQGTPTPTPLPAPRATPAPSDPPTSPQGLTSV